MIGSRLYAAHKTNNLFVSYIEALNKEDVASDEYLSIDSGVYSVRGIQVTSAQNVDSIRGIPTMYLMLDVALLAYEDSRTNSEFKVISTTIDGKIIPDTNREVTSRFQYELSAKELKEAIDGGLYESATEYETQLTEQLRSTIFKDRTANIRVRLYDLGQETVIRVVNEHSYLTKIAPKQNTELSQLLKSGMQTISRMNKEGKRHEIKAEPSINLFVEPKQAVTIELDDLLSTDSISKNSEYTVVVTDEVKEIEIDANDKLDLGEVAVKIPTTDKGLVSVQKENVTNPKAKKTVDNGLEF